MLIAEPCLLSRVAHYPVTCTTLNCFVAYWQKGGERERGFLLHFGSMREGVRILAGWCRSVLYQRGFDQASQYVSVQILSANTCHTHRKQVDFPFQTLVSARCRSRAPRTHVHPNLL